MPHGTPRIRTQSPVSDVKTTAYHRTGAAYAFDLTLKDGSPRRRPNLPQSPFSPRSKHLWGYMDTKTAHKVLPEQPRITPEIDRATGKAVSPRLHPGVTDVVRKSGEPMPQSTQLVWLVERSVEDFRKQGRYRPFPKEFQATLPGLLKDLTHIKGEMGWDEFKVFAQLTLNSNGGKIVAKPEEMKECFERIDADGGGTLDKDEIFHALTIDWELIKFLRASETLKPLLSLRNWRKAMDGMKEPDRRLAASCKLVETTADGANARLVKESGAMHIFVTLLRPSNGPVAINVAGTIANLLWHCRDLQESMPFDFPGHSYFESSDRETGLIPLLLSSVLGDDAKATVIVALHNFCWKCSANKVDLVEHFLGAIEEELLRLREYGATKRARMCSAALLTMLMVHS